VDTAPGRPFEEFVATVGPNLVRLGYLVSADMELAEDAAQAVLLRLSERGIDDLRRPDAYARRAVVNEIRDSQRRARTQKAAAARIFVRADVPGPDELSADALTVQRALGSLPMNQRTAVVMRFYWDSPTAEIAEVIGCAQTTVRVLLHRAMKTLRKVIGEVT